MTMNTIFCSALNEDGTDIRSLVDVFPVYPSCVISKVNKLLKNYLITQIPTYKEQGQPSRFQLYAPPDPLGPSYGIYTSETTDPVAAKQLALGHCMAGEATVVSNKLIVDKKVAVVFSC